MSDSQKTLTTKQLRAIQALMSESTVERAAKTAGISSRQLRRWLELPEVQNALREAERVALDSAIRRLASLAGIAVDTLREAMESKAAVPGSRVRAADTVLSRIGNLKETMQFEDRLSEMEQEIARLRKVEK